MPLLRDIRMVLTLSCSESSRLLSDGMERRLTRCERLALRLHLLVCRSCRRFGRNIQFLRRLMHRTLEDPCSSEGPASLTSQERRRIAAEVRKRQSENP